MNNINQILEFDRLAREDGRKYNNKRAMYDTISKDTGDHFIGIVELSGVLTKT